ncbi:MAG TPA: rhamnulokinase family protein [Vicinamibacteria bacterium]|nr:rhamnulokinase family protein [Vicinamibacteria bacterium]
MATQDGASFHVAIDLGAGSGRAMLGRLLSADCGGPALLLEEIHRFHYPPLHHDGHLRWPFPAVLDGIKGGLRAASRAAAVRNGAPETVGVDSWGVDYGLVDAAGRLLQDPVCYRDHRTDGAIERVLKKLPRAEIFQRTGIQFQQFNTLFQLHEHVREGLPSGARRLLMIPDLCHHSLCGATSGELTDASTTQLVDVRTRRWADDLFSRLGLPRELMPELRAPGTPLGELRPSLQKELHLPALSVLAPATHDTASAVAGTPLQPGWAYVSSGTWSLVGTERPGPLVNEAVARANFTNEAGVFGTVRFLRNVMGLWILDSCRHEWEGRGLAADLDGLLAAAGAIEKPPGLVYPDHPRFFNPRSMTAELQAALAETGQKVPDDPARLTRVVLDSLAFRYASVVRSVEQLTGEPIPGIHIVGGGSLNEYLDQATADAAQRPVLAGPAEAAATGNLLMQAFAAGRIRSLEEGRRLVEAGQRPRRFEPRERAGWREAGERYREVEGRYQ